MFFNPWEQPDERTPSLCPECGSPYFAEIWNDYQFNRKCQKCNTLYFAEGETS